MSAPAVVLAGSRTSAAERHARDLELAALYQGGATLQEIGDAVGLTDERVRQRIARLRSQGFPIRQPPRTRRGDLVDLGGVLARYRAGRPLSRTERRLTHALGLPPRRRARLPRAERRRRRVEVEAAVRELARTFGRAPTYGEVAEAVLGVPRHDPAGKSRLVAYVTPARLCGTRTRLLRAIWRRCGLAPRGPYGTTRDLPSSQPPHERAVGMVPGSSRPRSTPGEGQGTAHDLRREIENRTFLCGLCGGVGLHRAYRGGRPQRYCSTTCRRLAWCRDQLVAAGYSVGRRNGGPAPGQDTELVTTALVGDTAAVTTAPTTVSSTVSWSDRDEVPHGGDLRRQPPNPAVRRVALRRVR